VGSSKQSGWIGLESKKIGITIKENSSKKANQKKQKPTQWSKQTLRKKLKW